MIPVLVNTFILLRSNTSKLSLTLMLNSSYAILGTMESREE